MNTKSQLLIITSLLYCVVLTTQSFSQSFSLFSIDTTNYPVLRAKFLNVTADGFLSNIPQTSLQLKENSAPRTILSVNCPIQNPPIPLSAVLAVDVSASMGFGALNATNMVFAKAAANAWINTLSVGNSEMALTSFDQFSYLLQDFTKDKTKLKNALVSLVPQGQTDFNKAFLTVPTGAISIAKNGKYKRIILFVTDGDAPDTDIARIASEAQNNSITVYAISIGRDCPQSLKDISLSTGGLWFEDVQSSLRAEQIFFEIFSKESQVSPCEITWESLNQCKAETIIVSLENTENNSVAQLPYKIPLRKKGTIQANPASVAFSDLPLFVPKDTTIYLRANGANTTISSITSSNPRFSVTPTSGVILENDSIPVVIRYTPTDSTYQWSEFTIEHSFCTASFYSSARYSNAQFFPVVQLIAPNGGETYLSGSDTLIRWDGISPSDTVQLEYSNNNGNSWNLIESAVTGGSYRWKLPNQIGNNFLVKVSLTGKNDILTDGWAKRSGSFFEEIGYSLCTTSDGSILSTGSFQGLSSFGSTTIQLTSQGAEDVFVLKIRPDGSPEWAKGIGGIGKDIGRKILTLSDNSFVVIGTFQNSITFEQGNQNQQTLTSNGGFDIFVARYLADGTFVSAFNEGGMGNDIVTDATRNQLDEILLTGTFTQTINFGNFQVSSSGLSDVFLASITPQGLIQWATSFGGSNNDEGTGIGVSSDGSIYVAATVRGSFPIGSFPIVSTGFDGNIALVKYNSTKSIEWVEQIGGIFEETANALEVDANNDILLSGTFIGTFNLQNTFFISNGLEDALLLKFDRNKTLLWGTSFGGVNFDKIRSVYTDKTASVYLAGFVEKLSSIGNSELVNYGSKDVLIAKYSSAGVNEWAITAGGNVVDEGYDVFVDNNGSVFSTGFFNSNARFGIFSLNTSSGFNEIFHWKIPTIRRKSFDISDTTFSLIRVQPITDSLDFGEVLLQTSKDSVFQQSLRNSSPFSLVIDSVSIEPPTDFRLFSSIPFQLSANEEKDIEYSFAPSQLGLRQSSLRYWVRSTDSLNNATTVIKGIGVQPQLLVETPIIDFGDVEVSTNKDTIIPVVLRNVGNVPLTILGSSILGPNTIDFVQLSPTTSITLQPNDVISTELRFSPKVLGRTQSTIEFNHDGIGEKERVFLFGNGIDYNQSIYSLGCQTIESTVGSIVSIPLQVATIKSGNTFSNEIVKGFMKFNETILAPIQNTPKGVVINGDRIIPFEFSLKGVNELSYTFRVGLGNDSMTSISFENVTIENSTAEMELDNCSVLITDLCYKGGTRLVKSNSASAIVSLNYNQSSTTVDVLFSTIEDGSKISLITLLGTEVFSKEVQTKESFVQIPFDNFANGIYYVVLSSPTIVISKPVVISR